MDGFLFLKTMFTMTSFYTFYKFFNNMLLLQKIYSQNNFTFDDDIIV